MKLPSGATLKLNIVPFAEARELYQIVLEELKGIPISGKTELPALYKDLFCTGFASKRIEAALWVCFARMQYVDRRGALKIDDQTFEPIEARDDYMTACMEVGKFVIAPFVKSLYARYEQHFKEILGDLS